MPYRRLPQSNKARLSAIRVVKDRKDATPPALVPLMGGTQTQLDTFHPIYNGLMLAVGSARALQTEQSAVTTPLRNAARLWVGHGYQALINAVIRKQFSASVLGHYLLPSTAKGAPDMGTEQAIIDAFNAYEAGEAARVAAGGMAISFPAGTDISTHVSDFRAANLIQAERKDAYDNAQEALAAQNPEADRLILKLWNEIEAAFDKGDKPSMRRKAREWGVIYVPSPGETPSPEDYSVMGRILDSLTRQPLAEVEVSLDGTTVSVTTDSDGNYYIPFTTAGSYTLRASLPGYITHTQTVTIADDTLPEVNIALVQEVPEEE